MKGGQSIKMITYNVFGTKRSLEVPLKNVNCKRYRTAPGTFVALKLKGRLFYFIMDKRDGIFHNEKLFDHVVGLQRDLKA